MKIGMRTIKTAIAVALTIFISQILNLESPFFAGIAATITMQSSVVESFKTGKNRMLGTMLGASIGLVASLIAPGNPIVIGISIIIVIYLCNIFGWKKSVTIACIVLLSIILNQKPGNRLNYSIYRTLDTFLGIIIGVLINYFILPPNMEKKIKSSCNKILDECINLIESLIWDHEEIKLDNVKNNLKALENSYNTLKEELDFNVFKKTNCKDLKDFYTYFDDIYSNLKIISSIDGNFVINTQNRKLLKEIYKKELTDIEEKKLSKQDIVFNFHLNKILEKLKILIDATNFENIYVEEEVNEN